MLPVDDILAPGQILFFFLSDTIIKIDFIVISALAILSLPRYNYCVFITHYPGIQNECHLFRV